MSEGLINESGSGLDKFSGPGAPSTEGSVPPLAGAASGL
jgi:hypothetical protein